MSTTLLTFCWGEFEKLWPIVEVNFTRYCTRHSYELLLLNKPLEIPGRPYCPGFAKIETVAKRFGWMADGDIIWCLDFDAIITNHELPITSFLDEIQDCYITHDINTVNCGSMIFRNSARTRAWLAAIMAYAAPNQSENDVFTPCWQAWEKLNWLKVLPHPSINSYPYEDYAPSYGKIGWNGEAVECPTHERGCWRPGDFVMHIPALSVDKKLEIMRRTLGL